MKESVNRRPRKVRVNTEKRTGQSGGDVEIRDPRGSSGALRALAEVTVCKLDARSLGRRR